MSASFLELIDLAGERLGGAAVSANAERRIPRCSHTVARSLRLDSRNASR